MYFHHKAMVQTVHHFLLQLALTKQRVTVGALYTITQDLVLYFVDRASCHKFMLITNLMHFFMYLFIHFISLHTRWYINTIRSPDDEHLMLETCREMKWINKYVKKCIRLFINMNDLVRFSYAVMFSDIAAGYTHVCHVVHITHRKCYSWHFPLSVRYFVSTMILFGGNTQRTLSVWSRL